MKQGWTEEEDYLILHHVQHVGARWSLLATTLLGRTDDAIRNRYLRLMRKYASPPVHERGGDMWTAEEDQLITDAVHEYGQKWQTIAELLPGRSANAVRNRYLRYEKTQASLRHDDR